MGNWSADAADFLNGNITVNDNNWHLVGFTWDGSITRFYTDGALDNTKAMSFAQQTVSNGNSLGAIDSGLGRAYIGSIDEVVVSNIARTADQIRQAYEYGLRTHSITIDFAAKLDSANLISGSADTSFTVDATAYGLAQKGANLYPGDKIIVRENIGGTEYIVQGTIRTVDAATGAVTVLWDSGLTSSFPSAGFTANASVFKWQREYFDLSGSLASQRDAITNLTLRPTNGAEGRTVYLDDLRKAGITSPLRLPQLLNL